MRRVSTDKERTKFDRFVRGVFTIGDPTKLQEHLAGLHSIPEPYRIRLKLIYATRDPLDVLSEQRHNDQLEILDPKVRSLFYSDRIGREKIRKISGPIAVLGTRMARVHAIIALSDREFWRAGVLRLVSRSYPDIAPIYLSQRELHDAIRGLQDAVRGQFRLRVHELSLRERPAGSERHHRTKSVREWTDEALDAAFAQAVQRGQTFRSISFALHRVAKETELIYENVVATLSKKAELTLNGEFALLYGALVERVARVGFEKLDFYSRRGLRARQYKPAPPIAINYPSAVLRSASHARQLSHALTRYPHSTYAAVHANPYVHVHIADSLDGSSFEIWGLSPTRILVVPRLHASEAALERIVNYIFEEFREGSVEEYAGWGVAG